MPSSSFPSFFSSGASATDGRPLDGHVAIVTGASRGIGRDIALTLAKAGCNVVIAAKTVTPQPTLPGTIYTVADEARAYGVKALPIRCDVLDDKAVASMVSEVARVFNNRIDILICNSGALWIRDLENTPMSRYDLVNGINARATFACIRQVLPYMKAGGFGRIVVMSPPIDLGFVAGKVAYSISKFGMSLIAIGLAKEMQKQKQNIAINALWPKTLIESFATKNFKIGTKKQWRKASIISDCCLFLAQQSNPDDCTGRTLIDEDYLRTQGVTDFTKYRVVPTFEPDSAWPPPETILPKDTTGLPPGIGPAKL